MNQTVLIKSYPAPPVCKAEIMRYAGGDNGEKEISLLLEECINEVADKLSYKVCYCELPVNIENDTCDLGLISVKSKNLAQNLKGCKSAILFAATIGVELDRAAAKYGRLFTAKGLLLESFGAERIEALCNTFCEDIKKEYSINTKPRFSPGYGDFPLCVQKDIFSVLGCEKRIGLTLNDSMLMSPSKSVTAILGLTESCEKPQNKCSICNKKDCTIRGAL